MKIILALLVLTGAAWALLLYNPSLYFGKTAEYKGFTLMAHGEAPAGYEPALDAARERLASSEFFKEDSSFRVALAASPGEFKFFAPFQEGEYFRVSPLSGVIFVAAADFKTNDARPAYGSGAPRAVSQLLAAAAAVDLVRRGREKLAFMSMKGWLLEGYAERISGGTGAYEPHDACGDVSGDPNLRSYKHGLMLDVVLREEGISYGDLLNRNYGEEGAEARMRKVHCGG